MWKIASVSDMQMFVGIIISGIISACLTGLVLKLAKKRGVLPIVRVRDTHKTPLPRIGGVAIFGAFLITVLIFRFIDPPAVAGFGFPFAVLGFSIDKRLLALLTGGLVLVLAMLYDDLRGLKAYQKLLTQVVVALIVIVGGIGVSYINNPFGGPEWRLDGWQIPISLGSAVYHLVVLADVLVVLWLVLLMNVLNFSDGIDGLAGSIGVISLGVLAILSSRVPVLQESTALIARIGVGAVLGFLLWNLPPARIFMGDSGSMFLGFLIGVLAIIAGAKLATTLVVLAIPILDALFVVCVRIIKNQNPFTTADQSHLHHKFLQVGLSVRQTLTLLVSFSLLFGLAALQNDGLAKARAFIVAIIVVAMTMVSVQLLIQSKKRKQI